MHLLRCINAIKSEGEIDLNLAEISLVSYLHVKAYVINVVCDTSWRLGNSMVIILHIGIYS